ncbi:hypothetical protein WJX72_007426 [[Myrmecia] bisecta]|uniref:Uncharacterized protein n=1 Tax=[Myrmecia] bisecta TaxID=41462 RepID=A0AAW1PKB3_9CHLO
MGQHARTDGACVSANFEFQASVRHCQNGQPSHAQELQALLAKEIKHDRQLTAEWDGHQAEKKVLREQVKLLKEAELRAKLAQLAAENTLLKVQTAGQTQTADGGPIISPKDSNCKGAAQHAG